MSKYRSTWHLLPEQTYAFDYDFTLSMPSYKIRSDGDSFKEYEGTIKATGKDAKEAKEKAEKELLKRIDAAEKSTKGSLEDPFNSILQQGRAVSEGLEEFTLVHTVRYLDPKNGKRFAAPYKTKEKAQAKMDQLKRDGVKDISITQDTLRGNIKFKEGVFNEDTDQERLAKLRTRQMELQMKVRNMDQGDPKTKTPMAIAKNDIENIQMRMDQIKDRARRKSMNEEGDHEISMARGELEAISDKALELSSALEGMSDEGNPLEAWVQSKITKAKDYINSVSDYLMYNPDIKMNEEKFEVTGEVDYFGAPNPKDFEVTVSAKDAAEAKQKVMDKYQKGKKRVSSVGISSVQKVNEEIKSDDDYQAKKKALQDIQNDPKQAAVVGTEKLRARKDKLEKDYADFKSKDKIAASKEFEKDLAAEADLTKGQIKKVHKMADELPKKDFKDRYGKEKGDSVRYATATNIVKKKEGIKEMQQIDEKIEGLKNKSEKSGIPYGILKQVYNRGMAAWKGGHRPGTTPQQWAMARVNAFITKGKAYYTADADLAKKARAAKKGK